MSAASDSSPAALALEALGLVVFLRDDAGALRLHSNPPDWLRAIWPAAATTGNLSAVSEQSPFLENFLIDAEECWRAGEGRARSGPWVQAAGEGADLHLEATALTAGGFALLLLERLGEVFAAKKEVLQKARETVIALQRLNSEMQKKEVLLHCVAEEMTAALANTITSLRLLELEHDPVQMRHLHTLATRSTEAQQSLIHRVLDAFADDLSSFYGAASAGRAKVDLGEILPRAAEHAAPLFSEKGVQLDVQLADGAPHVVIGEAVHLQRVAANLLENALHHTSRGKRVTAMLSAGTDTVDLRIASSEVQPDLCTNLFSRIEPSAATPDADLLRLHFCRIVVENYGGEIECEAAASGGSVVTIRLPKAIHSIMKTVVLIDNDALTRALLSHCLAGGGWRVLEAEDGDTGLNLVVQHKPAAVICDLRTPKLNGFKVCRAIREQTHLAATRVILTTVSRYTNDRDTALAAGADDYLIKPISARRPAPFARQVPRQGPDLPLTVPAEPSTAQSLSASGACAAPFPRPDQTPSASAETPPASRSVSATKSSCSMPAPASARLGLALLKEFKDKPLAVTMLVTHTHWDHIQGFPFFLPAYNPNVSVRILGYEGAVHGLRGALLEQMQSAFFPVALNQMAGRVTFEELDDMQFDLGLVKVRTMFSNHPGICLAYRLSTPAGDIVYMPDHEAYERFEIERQKAAGENSAPVLQHARQQDEIVISFIREADVLIADSQYDALEYPSRRGWGHTCADDTVDLALRAGVKRLFLFHHDPDHHDEKIAAMVARAQERVAAAHSPLLVTAAQEGAELVMAPRQSAPTAVEATQRG